MPTDAEAMDALRKHRVSLYCLGSGAWVVAQSQYARDRNLDETFTDPAAAIMDYVRWFEARKGAK